MSKAGAESAPQPPHGVAQLFARQLTRFSAAVSPEAWAVCCAQARVAFAPQLVVIWFAAAMQPWSALQAMI